MLTRPGLHRQDRLPTTEPPLPWLPTASAPCAVLPACRTEECEADRRGAVTAPKETGTMTSSSITRRGAFALGITGVLVRRARAATTIDRTAKIIIGLPPGL